MAKIIVRAVKSPVLKVPPKSEARSRTKPDIRTREVMITAFPVPKIVSRMASCCDFPRFRSSLYRVRNILRYIIQRMYLIDMGTFLSNSPYILINIPAFLGESFFTKNHCSILISRKYIQIVVIRPQETNYEGYCKSLRK